MPIFKGAGVAIVTPMKENLEVNYELLERNINYQIDNGTDAIIIAGTTGESATLSEEEHKKVVKAAIEFTKHRVPVIAGTGSNSTQTAIELSQEADKDGADAVLIVTPYYNKATQKGLIAHYTSVANSIKVPVIMYNVPSRTGCGLNPETIAHLVKNVDNIVGLKDATGDLSHAAKTMNLCVLSNIAPRQTHDIVMEFLEGDYKKAAKLQLDAIPLINALFCEVNPIPVKTAMNMLGWEAGPLRAPLCEMEDAHKEMLRQEMIRYGLLK